MNKSDAKALGLKHYTGKSCKVCGFLVRRVEDGQCYPCYKNTRTKKSKREWFARNNFPKPKPKRLKTTITFYEEEVAQLLKAAGTTDIGWSNLGKIKGAYFRILKSKEKKS